MNRIKIAVLALLLAALGVSAAEVVPEVVAKEAIFWLDAADASTISLDASGVVTAWSSKAGDRRVATATAERPAYDTTTYGIPVVDFGAPGSGKDFRYSPITGIRTVFLVAKVAKGEYQAWLGNIGTAPDPYPPPYFVRNLSRGYLYTDSAAANRVWYGQDEVLATTQEEVPTDTFIVLCLGTKAPGVSDSLTNDRLLKNRNGGRQMSELILFNRDLTDAERIGVTDYLTRKWKVLAGARAAELFRPMPPPQRMVVANDKVSRVVKLADGKVLGESYRLLGGGEFMRTNSREFSLQVNGKTYTGASDWKDVRVTRRERTDGGEETDVSFTAPDGAFAITLAYSTFPGLPLVAKTLRIENRGKGDLKLGSVCVEDFATTLGPTESLTYRQYGRFSVPGPYVGNWDDPLVVLHDLQARRGLAVGNETVGVIKRTSTFEEGYSLRAGVTMPSDPHPFRRWLKPGESWTSAAVFTAPFVNESDPQSVVNGVVGDYVRKHMAAHVAKLEHRPTFVYANWSPFGGHIDERLCNELVDAAADCGVEEFLLDAVWYVNRHQAKAPSYDFQHFCGDWIIDPKKFPNGLKPLFDRVRARGMRPGLWFALASADFTSEVYLAHPEWHAKDAQGKSTYLHTSMGNSRAIVTMCLGTDWYAYIRDMILTAVKEHGLAYVKLDLTIAASAYIYLAEHSGCYAKNHPGHRDRAESFDVIYSRCMQLFDELHQAAPDLYVDCTFETAGKLQLMDYGIARHADGNWLSNISGMNANGNLRMRSFAWGRTPALPASSLVIGNLEMNAATHLVDYKSVLGAFPMMLGDPRRLSSVERAEFKLLADWVKGVEARHGFMLFRQDLAGFGEPGDGRWDGYQRINTETKSGGLVGVFRQNAAEASRQVVVQGLDPVARYAVTRGRETSPFTTMTGAELAERGFRVEFKNRQDGELFEITRQ